MLKNEFPVNRIAEIISAPEHFKLIEIVPLVKQASQLPIRLAEDVGDEEVLVILDLETDGLNEHENDSIELGMVKVRFSPSQNCLIEITDSISMFEQPRQPIGENITEITGITNDMLDGQSFDEEMVATWFEGDPIIVAHNASFDRKFFETRFPELGNFRWGCSIANVDWPALGFGSKKLEYLLSSHGFFYPAHRAEVDCLALAWLLHINPDALRRLLNGIRTSTVTIRAIGAPFEVKDVLKASGYSFDYNGETSYFAKHWYKSVPGEDEQEELDFLCELYSSASNMVAKEYITSRERFK